MMTISSHLVISLLFIVSPVTQGFDSIDVKIIPGTQQSVAGTLTFSEYGKGILIKGKITGLTPGLHGFHIHEKGDLSNYCVAAGPHFNPYQKTHGDISDANRHSGDLGNILADTYGVAHVELHDKIITLDPHSKDYVGYRAIVVHEGIDDLGKGQNEESTKTGNAGKRAGCGFISAGHLPSTIAPHHLTLGCIFLAALTKKLF